MNLHLVNDEKFINDAVDLFEKYYPQKNIFIVDLTINSKPKFVNSRREVFFYELLKPGSVGKVLRLARKYKVKNIIIHFYSPIKGIISNTIKDKLNVTTYWVFYGADLYGRLMKDFGYKLHDYPMINNESLSQKAKDVIYDLIFLILGKVTEKRAFLTYIHSLNFFCFWNYYDYELLKKHYGTNASYKYFRYFQSLVEKEPVSKSNNLNNVIINNSASINGNHLTVMEKLHSIDKYEKIDEVIVPLSYGNKHVKHVVEAAGRKLFGGKFNPITNFMNKETYFSILDNASVAVFGARRQEGAGTIFYLLFNGTKVFLREENNMLNYLKDQGFIVFSFEQDLNSASDIQALESGQRLQNLNAYKKIFNKSTKEKVMENLLKN